MTSRLRRQLTWLLTPQSKLSQPRRMTKSLTSSHLNSCRKGAQSKLIGLFLLGTTFEFSGEVWYDYFISFRGGL